jgi:hypothetical protein
MGHSRRFRPISIRSGLPLRADMQATGGFRREGPTADVAFAEMRRQVCPIGPPCSVAHSLDDVVSSDLQRLRDCEPECLRGA